MSETEVGNVIIVSPSIPPLTCISSTSDNRVSNCLSVSLTHCNSQEVNNILQNRLQKIERNISNVGEFLHRFIEAQRILWEQVRNEGKYSTKR